MPSGLSPELRGLWRTRRWLDIAWDETGRFSEPVSGTKSAEKMVWQRKWKSIFTAWPSGICLVWMTMWQLKLHQWKTVECLGDLLFMQRSKWCNIIYSCYESTRGHNWALQKIRQCSGVNGQTIGPYFISTRLLEGYMRLITTHLLLFII